MKQLNLLSRNELGQIKSRCFGGMNVKKRRKTARPLQVGLIHHVVFKSRKAQGALSFFTHKKLVAELLKDRSQKYFIEILDWVNMGNHLHLKVRFKDRERFQNFIRTFAAILARKITGSHRGKSFGRFWDGLVFTRVLTSKLEELGLRIYFEGNHRERELGAAARKLYLQNWNQLIYKLRATRVQKT